MAVAAPVPDNLQRVGFLCCAQDDLKAEALASGQAYLADPSYQEATQMSFADLFKKVC
jgi:hypothetical protein